MTLLFSSFYFSITFFSSGRCTSFQSYNTSALIISLFFPFSSNVIKLTAKYVARNGQKFLTGLGQRERGNPQFAFLKATHPLFPYFTSLVDAYSKCLLPEKATTSRLKQDVGLTTKLDSAEGAQQWSSLKALSESGASTAGVFSSDNIPKQSYRALFSILYRVRERQRWEAHDEKQREEKEKREAEERDSIQALDWHEFAVVECITFTDEVGDC